MSQFYVLISGCLSP